MQYDLAFTDETIDINRTSSYHLSIQSSLNGFSFCILDTVNNKYVLFRHKQFDDLPEHIYYEQLEEIVKKEELLDYSYKSSAFLNQTRKATLVPSVFFNKDNVKNYFEFNHQLDNLDELHYQYIPLINAYVVFAVHNYVAISLTSRIKNVEFFHQSTPLLKRIEEVPDSRSKDKQVLIDVNRSFFDVLAMDGEKLLFYNSFQYRSAYDLLYFVLYVYNQLNLKSEEVPLIISGELQRNSEYTNLLKEYIGKIKFQKSNPAYLYSYTFDKLDEHRFSTLFNLKSCV